LDCVVGMELQELEDAGSKDHGYYEAH
jgi:hypothetical protein